MFSKPSGFSISPRSKRTPAQAVRPKWQDLIGLAYEGKRESMSPPGGEGEVAGSAKILSVKGRGWAEGWTPGRCCLVIADFGPPFDGLRCARLAAVVAMAA